MHVFARGCSGERLCRRNVVDEQTQFRAGTHERGGTPEASVWFDAGPRLPAAEAARINAVMSDAAASDDSDLRNIAHIGTIVTATSLALGERTGASGREVLAAMVLGYEVAGRIDEALTPGRSERGFHGSVATVFGGAVASGTLLRLDAEQMTQASPSPPRPSAVSRSPPIRAGRASTTRGCPRFSD